MVDSRPIIHSLLVTVLSASALVCYPPYVQAQNVSEIPALIQRLQDPRNPTGREEAAIRLGTIGTRAVPALIQVLEELDFIYVRHAAEALRMIGTDARDAVPALLTALKHPGGTWSRTAVARALASVGSVAITPLVDAVRDNHLIYSAEAAFALGLIGSPAVDPLLALVRELDRYSLSAPVLVEALASAGRGITEVLQVLLRTIRSDDPDVGNAAVHAIATFGSVALPGLTETVEHEPATVQMRAIASLGHLGPSASPVLIRALEGDADDIRIAATIALGAAFSPKVAYIEIQPGVYQQDVSYDWSSEDLGLGSEASLALVRLLADSNARVREEAIQALATLGPIALPRLEEAVKDVRREVRLAAAFAIAESVISSNPTRLEDDARAAARNAARAAIPDLIAQTASSDMRTRERAIRVVAT